MTSAGGEIVGTFGVVASTHWLATSVAMGVLERGGNAFDAAVAGGFALHAAQPHQNSPGGEVPIVFWSARERRARVLAGQGTAPAAASILNFSALGLDEVPGTGLLAATVPGAFGGWMTLLEHYGTVSLRDVLEPAIRLLRDGISAGELLTSELGVVGDLFREEWPTSEAQWGGAREAAAHGRLVTNLPLAHTYERVLDEAEMASHTREGQIRAAQRVWYSGFVAEAIDAFSAGTPWLDSSGEKHRGLLSGQDLAGWQATFEEPVVGDYHEYQLAKTASWGQGPVALQHLALLEGLDLDGFGDGDPDTVHAVVETSKLAFADREAWYGDAADPAVIAELVGRPYAAGRRGLVGDVASTDIRPGSPLGRSPRLYAGSGSRSSSATGTGGGNGAARGAARGVGEPNSRGIAGSGIGEPNRPGVGEPNRPATPVYGDTCHIDVVDAAGNMVSATPSGGWLQSSPAIPGLGFCLGTRAQMFWLENGLPNSLAPGSRPRTTLSPSLAFRDGEPWMVFGTPGGDGQDQWSLTFFLHAVHGRDGQHALRSAVDAPRLNSDHVASSFYPRQAFPNRLVVESDLGAHAMAGLRARGHDVVEVAPRTLGKVTAITREGSVIRAVADARTGEPHATGR